VPPASSPAGSGGRAAGRPRLSSLAILDDYQGVSLTLVDWAAGLPGVSVVAFGDHLSDEDALVARLAPFDAVVAMRERTPFGAGLLARLPNLALLITTGPFNAAIDLAAARDSGVVVCGTGGTASPTAELTWGLILALARHVPAEDGAVRAGRWQHTVGVGLEGKTLGLVGLGRLGGRVAAVGSAFGMRLVAWSPHLTAERAARHQAELVDKATLFASADVVSVHLVLGEGTRGLIAEKELRAMRPSAYLVNTSRGPIIDEVALVRALSEGWIAGAGLDVFDEEPLPLDHPLRRMPRTVLTPHLGYVTEETYRIFYGEALEDARAFQAGVPVRVIEPR